MTAPDLDDIRALIDDESDRARKDMPSIDYFINNANARRRRRRGGACVAVMSAVLLVGGVGWARGAATPADLRPAASSSSPTSLEVNLSTLPDNPRPDQVADLISDALDSRGRNGGGTWIAEERTLNVYVAGPEAGRAEATSQMQRLADQIVLTTDFKIVVHEGGARTEDQLVTTMDEVSKTQVYDPDKLVFIRGQRIDFKAGQVEVDVTSDAAARLIEKQFGDAVRVRVKEPYTQEELDQIFGMHNAPAAPTDSGTSGNR